MLLSPATYYYLHCQIYHMGHITFNFLLCVKRKHYMQNHEFTFHIFEILT